MDSVSKTKPASTSQPQPTVKKKGPLAMLRDKLQLFTATLEGNEVSSGKGPKKGEVTEALKDFKTLVGEELSKIKDVSALNKFLNADKALCDKLAKALIPVVTVLSPFGEGDVKAILENALSEFGQPLNKLAEPRDEKSQNTYIDLLIEMAK